MQRGPPSADRTQLQVGSILRAEAQGYTGPLDEDGIAAGATLASKPSSPWPAPGLAVGMMTPPPTAQPDIAAGGALLPQQANQMFPTDTKHSDPHDRVPSTDCKGASMHIHLRELQHEDQRCVFVVRGITKLGFNSQALLTAHFARYGEVIRVLVTHSKVKAFKVGPAPTTARVRPGSLGFVLMDTPMSVVRILEQGTHQTVGGHAIRVERFHQIQQPVKGAAVSTAGQAELASECSSDSGRCAHSMTGSASAQHMTGTPGLGASSASSSVPTHAAGLAQFPAHFSEVHTHQLASHFNELVNFMTQSLPNGGISAQASGLPQPQTKGNVLPPSTARVAALVHLLKEEFQQGALPAQSNASQHHGLPVTWPWPPASGLPSPENSRVAPGLGGLSHEVELYMSQLRGNLQAASSYEQQSALSRLACEQMEAWLQEQREQREQLQHLQRLQQLQQMQQIQHMQRQVEELAPRLQQIQEVINHVTNAAMMASERQFTAPGASEFDFNMGVTEVAALSSRIAGTDDAILAGEQHRAAGQKASPASWNDSDHQWQDQDMSSAVAKKKVNQKSPAVDAHMDKKKSTLGMHLHQLQDEMPECVFIARHIGGMGFQSQDLLESHFRQFGKVERVLVAHSKVKPFRRPGTHSRIRPGSLGFVVMEKKESVDCILALGCEQVVAGHRICVERFEKTAKPLCESRDRIAASSAGDSTTTADSTTPGSGSRSGSGSGSGSNSHGSEEGSANSGSNGSEEGSDKGNSANSGSNGSEEGSDKGNGSTEELQKAEGSQGGSDDSQSESGNRATSPGNTRMGTEMEGSSPTIPGEGSSFR
eukprot:TRINITY_DN57238_c0_g1_i1.p1 TRINITY_DN57238_c0_g1~~TRINITY_DN57238_c0_g1_i1.p1  ORF type:complete len:823 (-),score=140.48 TRINITY_DN57238_c0_g1_i1:211-2679(-)